MARTIQHKRGLEKNLPTLKSGELAVTTDTKKVFVGTDNGNIEVTNKAAVDSLTSQLAEMAPKKELLNANLIGVNNETVKDNVVIHDLFNRINSDTLGSKWTPVTGTWGIRDGAAAVVTNSGANNTIVVDSLEGDVEIEVTLKDISGDGRLIFRHTNPSNEYYLLCFTSGGTTEVRLGKKINGTATQLSQITVSPANYMKLKVKLDGSNIKAFVNGTKAFDINDTFNMFATKHGIGNNNSVATRFVNFQIKSKKEIKYPDTLIASVDNMLVDYKFGTLFLSMDGGMNYNHSLPIPNLSIIKFIHLFDDGKIMFADHQKVYYSHDWKTVHESIVLNIEGKPFVPAEFDNFSCYKNSYYKMKVDDTELAVWGNYSTLQGYESTARVRVWYTKDYGKTVKCCYAFNTPTSLPCRHIHNVDFNPDDNTFWIQTGDENKDSHWIKGNFDLLADKWTWTPFASGLNFKSTNMIFWEDGYVYWSWDKTPGGVVRAPIETMGDISTHELLFTTNKDCNNVQMGKNGDMIVFQTRWGGVESPRIMYYSPNRITFHKIVGGMPDVVDEVTDAQYQGHFPPNINGKILCGIQALSTQNIKDWDRKPSLFVDDYVRQSGFPNAFK